MPRTNIICTLGPASEKSGMILKMMRAGMDVVRLNFSHGKLSDHEERIKTVRMLNKKYRRHIRILGDLEGYRIRMGRMKGGKPVEVKRHQVVWLSQENILGEGDCLPFDYQGDLKRIKKGLAIFIDDGNIALVSEGVVGKRLKTRVVVGGAIKDHKGINMPDVILEFHGLTASDKEHLTFCQEHKVDYIAQSFVRSKEDILSIRKFLKGQGEIPQLIAKIENREGICNVDEILKVSDGIMVARGDMGVSIPIWEVPMVQKAIIRKCNRVKKFVITATQMLESMTENRLPTRAETTDVANAILDGTDFVMLSAETAVGVNPAGCVDVMNRIIKFTEENERMV
ncbi:MAG: pyruvate kinase [Candidatus Omnitrophica bacterium]|nr:pyruvate kinase [Candidatus Omnitrophota bacterium]